MHINYLFSVAGCLMLMGLGWMSIRDAKSKLDRLHLVTAMFGLFGLAQLTRDVVLPVVFDIYTMASLVTALFVVWAIVSPAFRRSDSSADEAQDLRQK